MSDKNLKAGLSEILAASRGVELLIAQAALVLVLLFSGSVQLEDFIPPQIAFSEQETADYSRLDRDGALWETRNLYSLDRIDGSGWLILSNPDLPADLGQPLALHVSGPFSAEVFWNGERIGFKGEPASDRTGERAGPIDTALSIPGDLIQDGENEIALRMSSHRAGYQPAILVQILAVGPFVSDARRSLRYYLPTLMLSGAILAIFGALALQSRARAQPLALWLALGMVALLIAIAAEVSRSFIAYPYDWHQPRQAIAFGAIGAFCLSVFRFASHRWPWPGPKTRQLGNLALLVSTLVALGLAFRESGYDHRSAWFSVTLLSASSIWLIWRGWREDANALFFGLGLAAIPLYAFTLPGDYLDRGLYALAASLFGMILLFRREIFFPPAPDKANRPAALAVQTVGKTIYMPLTEITHLKASGNYVEIHRRDGSWALDNRGLKAVLDLLPTAEFLRTHRSYAIRLDQAQSVKSAEGSRYSVTLKTGLELPLGRSRVSELRAQLAPDA